jgi:hypothetical protein
MQRPRRTPEVLLAIALAASGLAIPACGGDSGPSASEINETCGTVAASICNRIKRCKVDYRLARDYGSEAECNAQEKARCFRQSYRPKSAHTMAYQKTCAKARDTQTCDDFLNGAVLAACDTPVGPLKKGEACVDPAQCQSKYCRIVPTEMCGKCDDKSASGGACFGSGDCQDAFYCNKLLPTDVMGTCAKRAVAGEPCNPTVSCLAPDLVCSGYHLENGTPVDGSCQPRTAKSGQPCNDMKVCQFGLGCVGFDRTNAIDGTCQALGGSEGVMCGGGVAAGCDGNFNLYCTPMINTCARRGLVATGASCGTVDMMGTQTQCLKGDSCVQPIDVTTMMRPPSGVCTVRAGQNMACFVNSQDGPGCLPGLTCIPSAPGAMTGKCIWRDGGMCLGVKSEPYMATAPATK